MSLGQALLPCLHAGCSGAVDRNRLSPTKGTRCRGGVCASKNGHMHHANDDKTAYKNTLHGAWAPLLPETAAIPAPLELEAAAIIVTAALPAAPPDFAPEKSALSLPPAADRGVDIPMFLKGGKLNTKMAEGLEPSIERSLALTVLIYQNLARLKIADQVRYLEDFIVEHAERRLDAFFALLLAYDGSGMGLEITPPLEQKAHGNKALNLEAAHDSIITGVTDTNIEGDSPMKLRSGKKVPGRKCSKLSLYSSVLSATVELPVCVNDFDRMLEGKIDRPSELRKKAMEILNEVSKGCYSPIEGMQRFLVEFHKTLLELKESKESEESYIKKATARSPSEARELILSYIYKGSLRDKLVIATGYLVPEYKEFLEAQYESYKRDAAPKTALAFMPAITESKSIKPASSRDSIPKKE